MENLQIQTAVKECQNGQLNSFGYVYDAYIKKIFDYIYFRTHHKQLAEDLASLTFTKALQNIEDYREDAGTFQAWIYRIAHNTLIDHYRTNKQTSDLDEAFNVSITANFGSDIDTQNKIKEVQNYLTQLPPEARNLVIMRVWDNLSYQEIAEITGKTEASLKMSFSRIIAKLRTEVAFAILCLLILN